MTKSAHHNHIHNHSKALNDCTADPASIPCCCKNIDEKCSYYVPKRMYDKCVIIPLFEWNCYHDNYAWSLMIHSFIHSFTSCINGVVLRSLVIRIETPDDVLYLSEDVYSAAASSSAVAADAAVSSIIHDSPAHAASMSMPMSAKDRDNQDGTVHTINDWLEAFQSISMPIQSSI